MEIPPYPVSRPLGRGDKALLDSLFTTIQPRISELTFAGLFLFRKAHEYRLAQFGDSIIVFGTGYDGAPYFLPPLGGDVSASLNSMFADGLHLYGADDRFVDTFLSGDTLHVIELRDSHDYLYLRDELATLPGSRFHKKKNRINYFTNRHSHTVELYSSIHLTGCLNLLEKWQLSARNDAGRSLQLEMEATAEALRCADELGLEGVVVIVNDQVGAFALGERLNKDTAVCHFEKADPFCEGLYQLVNREFARLLFQDCRYLNREQDLGDTGLRSAKLSYHPVELVKKYLVTCRDNKHFVALCKKA
ncbi:MAG: DUF2156 domain-containing protein [Desulfuromonadaceae bacterium]|nr:DUF2156 domain-containing protein [Desulfuromonadaceae bacterium]